MRIRSFLTDCFRIEHGRCDADEDRQGIPKGSTARRPVPTTISLRALLRRPVLLAAFAGAGFCQVSFASTFAPIDLGTASGFTPVSAPDGSIEHYFTRGGPVYPDRTSPYGQQEVFCVRSDDEGRTWSDPEPVLSLPRSGKWFAWSPHGLYDNRQELHLFLLDMTDPGMSFWHTRRSSETGQWSVLKHVGACSPQNNPIQLRSGRILVPIGYIRPKFLPHEKESENAEDRPRWDTATGRWEIVAYYSDDRGETWRHSEKPIRVEVPIDYPHSPHNGGYEPVVAELGDGRVWMVIRTQTGHLHESFSSDGGETWSPPRATGFVSSDSPASVLRLANGDMVLVWNNCIDPLPVDGAWPYTGRDALHAAVSSDDGRTWQGYREIYRDPMRNESQVPGMGDRGTAYPCAAATSAGNVLVVSGQNVDRRRFILFDPDWLREGRSRDDFSTGLDGWSVFKAYGPVRDSSQARSAGAELVAHPTRPGAHVLHVRRPDEKPGDGAVWNFTSGTVGLLRIRIMLRQGFQGGRIALTDRFYYPDRIDPRNSTFALEIGADGAIGEGVALAPDRWHDIELAWQVEQQPPTDFWPGRCTVSIDGRAVVTLPQLNRAHAGISYLRLNSTAKSVDPSGFLVESVDADVTLQPGADQSN